MTKRMISYLRQAQTLSLVLVFVLLQVSCDQSQYGQEDLSDPTTSHKCMPHSLPPPRSAFAIQNGPTTQVGTEVAKDVGKIVASGEGSTNRTLFIFEERHDSRIAQMEIAVMLWRLQKTQGLRQVSLEGAFAAKGDLPATWFHDSTGSVASKQARQAAALTLLKEGEISAAEFMALLRPAVKVRGNEIESEYSVEPSQTNSGLGYLVAIAERSLSSIDAQRVNDLVKAQKIGEALDTIFSNDPWSRERYSKLYGDNIASTEESAVILQEVETKAKELGVRIESQQESGFRADLNFYRMASQRSCTIIKNTLAMVDPITSGPVALIIGAAHTPKIVESVKAAKLNHVVITPLSLVTGNKASKLTPQMYRRKMELHSIDEAGMLGALVDGRKKPPSLLDKQWLKSKAAIYAATDLIVAAATLNQQLPSQTLKAELQSLESIKVDWPSIRITKEGDRLRVMCKVTAQINDIDPNLTVDIWIVGWQQPPLPPAPGGHSPVTPDPDFGIEKLILEAIADGQKPVVKPSTTPGAVAVVQLSTRTKAAFSTDPTLLQGITIDR